MHSVTTTSWAENQSRRCTKQNFWFWGNWILGFSLQALRNRKRYIGPWILASDSRWQYKTSGIKNVSRGICIATRATTPNTLAANVFMCHLSGARRIKCITLRYYKWFSTRPHFFVHWRKKINRQTKVLWHSVEEFGREIQLCETKNISQHVWHNLSHSTAHN